MFSVNGNSVFVATGECFKIDPGNYYEMLNSSEDTRAVVHYSNVTTESSNDTAPSTSIH